MRFTWDPAKAVANQRKHGITFSEAATSFVDPLATYCRDTVHPNRGVLIAESEVLRILVTVYVDLEDDVIRIISARRASAHERRAYEEGD